VARLLILLALHVADRLTAFGPTRCTVTFWTEVLGADHFAAWLPAPHLAAVHVESLATSGTDCLIALRSTDLIALSLRTLPSTLWGALILGRLGALFGSFMTKLLVRTVARKVTVFTFGGSLYLWFFSITALAFLLEKITALQQCRGQQEKASKNH